MADLRKEGTDLVLDLSLMEKVLAKHGSLRVALSSVVGVEVVDDAKHAVGWVTLMGAAFPGSFGIGAFHSHTHTDAWPSRTDVDAAVDPAWHWVIVSLRHHAPVVRSFLIRDGHVLEEPVVVA